MRRFLFPLMLLLTTASGCVHYSNAVVSTQGKHYVVRRHPFGSDMLICELRGEQPICTKVVEQ